MHARGIATMVALATLSATAGCAPDVPEARCLRPGADALGLVVPAHAGDMTGLSDFARCALGEALYAGVPISVVTSEGRPQVVVTAAALSGTFNSDLARRKAVVAQANAIDAAVAELVPSSDGNDLNAALSMLHDLTRGAGAQRPHLVSEDSGLTDLGALRLTLPGMLVANVDEVVTEASTAGQCPVGDGTHVTFESLGYGVAPQELLTPADRAQVAALWTSWVTACGGTADERPSAATGEGPSTRFTVEPVQPSGYPELKLDDPITLAGESAFAFDHDRTDFKYPDRADEVLARLVDTLAAHPSWHLRIEGTTANGATDYPSLESLGLARAEAVKAALVTRGVAADRMVTVGSGYLADPPQVDAATSALNRRVILSFFQG